MNANLQSKSNMKKLYIYSVSISLSLMLIIVGHSLAQTITLSGVPNTLCANESFSVGYVGNGFVPNIGNVFQVEISDENGFFPAFIIGQAFSTSLSGSIYATIPETTVFGSGYRLRVVAVNTDLGPVVGADNGTDVNINCTTLDYYWIGGSGNWSDPMHWEYTADGINFIPATTPPQPDDNANFDNLSFPSGGTLTFDQLVDITDFYWEPGSGATSPVIQSNWNALRLNGDLVLDAGVRINFQDVEFNSMKEGIEINFGDNIQAGQNQGTFRFYSGGSWDLNSDLTASAIQIYNGSTLYTNDFQVDLSSGSIWADGAVGNTLDTGTSDIYLGGLTSNDMLITGTSIWRFNSESSWPGSIGRNLTLNKVIIESGEYNFDGNNVINDLVIMPGGGIILSDFYTTTISSSFSAVGTRDKMASITAQNVGVQATLTIGAGATVTTDFLIVQDNMISGPNAPYLADNSIDDGNNFNWNFNALTSLDYYWVGGSGNWSDNSIHWGKLPGGGGFRASPPGALDNVFFTTSSFPSGGVLNIDVDAECNNMTWEAGSGAAKPKIEGDWGDLLAVHGDFTLDNGVNRSLYYILFESGVGQVQNLNFADNVTDFGNITFQGGGTWELLSDLRADQIELYDGIFNTNNNQIDVDYLYFYDLTTSNWGSSTVNVYSSMNNFATTFTMDQGSSTFNFSPKYSNWTINLNGTFVFYDANFSGKVSINGDNFFNNLNFLPGAEVTLSAGNTQSVAGGAFSAMGLRDQPILIKSSTDGLQANISQTLGSVNTEYLILQDNNVLGGATFNTSNYSITGDPLKVTGWTFGTPLDTFDFYWVGGTGSWSDFANHWSQADGDLANMYSFAPGPSDNVFFTANSFSAGGQIVTLDNSAAINNMTWVTNSGTNNPAISSSNAAKLTVHGNLKMDNGVLRNLDEINFESPNLSNTIDMADNLGNAENSSLYFRGGGSWIQQGTTLAWNIYLEDATFNTAGLDLDANSLYLNSSLSTLNLGAANVYLNGLQDWSGSATVNAGTSTIFVTNDYNSFGGNYSLNNVKVQDQATFRVDDNIAVNTLTLDPGSNLTIREGMTLTTTSLIAAGTSSKPIRIQSSTTGNVAYISQATGAVAGNFLLISDNDAQTTGTATFSAANSINAGNTGGLWLLVQPVPKNYYWIGGSGDWSDVTHWATADGGSTTQATAPGIADNVFFTDLSFSGPNETVAIDQNAFCNNMIWTTTIAQSPTLFGPFDIPLKVFGSFILTDGVNRNVSELIFETYTSGNQINMADNLRGAFASLIFRGTGDWTLLSDFEAQDVEFSGGSFNTNNFTLRVDAIRFQGGDPMTFNAGNSSIRTSQFINNSWNNNLTFNKGLSALFIVETEESYNSIRGPFDFSLVDIRADADVSGSNSYVTFTVREDVTLSIDSYGGAQRVVSVLQLLGVSGKPIILKSSNSGEQGVFSVPSTGEVTADYVIFQDNDATGGASFVATNSSEISNVTGWTGLLPGQTISFPTLDDISTTGNVTLTATASSGLPVTYDVLPVTGTGSITSDIYGPGSVGLVSITAKQDGDGATYGAAAAVTQYIHANLGDFPNEIGQMKQASYVVGAPNGVTVGGWQFTDKTLPQVTQTIVSPDGKLIAGGMGRVMIWDQLPDDYDVPADVVVGQADFTSFNSTPSRTSLGLAGDIFTGGVAIGPSGQLIVSDGRGVLIWNSIPTTNGAPADVIIGQTNFTSTTMAAAQDKFMSPLGVAVSSDGKLVVGDIAGHRVLIFNSIPTTDGAMADFVIGQPDFTSSSPGTSQTSFAFPGYITITPDDKLLVADITNNRVLIYNSIPTANNVPADAVLGQPDFNSNTSANTSATTLQFPMCIAVSRTGKVAISDWRNNRVLIYNALPTSNTTPADLVLGQPDFNTSGYVEDDISLRTMAAPFGVFWDQAENLLITDSGFEGFSRVMVYGAIDTEPPVLSGFSSSLPASYALGSNALANVSVTDRSSIASANVFFQEVSRFNPQAPTYQSASLTDLGTDAYELNLGLIDAFSNPTGIEFYIEVTDAAGNMTSTAANKQVLPIYYPAGTSIDKFGVGNKSEDYRLMAMPLELDNKGVVSVFQNIYGANYDKSKMRIFELAAGAADYTELSANSNLLPGKGYFALAASGSPASISNQAGTTGFSFTQAQNGENIYEFTIGLKAGWNLIGNPFVHPVKWADIVSLSGITSEVDQLKSYSGGITYDDITTIPTGGGAFVFAASDFTLRIPAYETGSGGRISGIQENKNPLSEDSWEVNFKTKNGKIIGGIGMNVEAEASKDAFDKMNLPAFGKMKVIEFNHPEYFYPSFSKDVRASAVEEMWEFEYKIENADNSKHTITWDNSYFGEDSPNLILVDKTHYTTIDMREKNSYTFNHGGITKFEVYFGDNARQQLMPEQIEVQSPYPNPFTNEVKINIGLPLADNEYKVAVVVYNTMGKQITTLTNATMDSGYYSFTWSGNNDSGLEVANGIYAYRVIVSGDFNSVIAGKIIKK
jgi:FlgD Ig-like domain